MCEKKPNTNYLKIRNPLLYSTAIDKKPYLAIKCSSGWDYCLVISVHLLLQTIPNSLPHYQQMCQWCPQCRNALILSKEKGSLRMGWAVRWDDGMCKLLNALDEEKHRTADSHECPCCPPGSGGDFMLLQSLKGTCH